MISGLRPAWALPGARVTVAGVHLPVPADGPPHVLIGADDAPVALASSHALALIVPEEAEGGLAAIRIDDEASGGAAKLKHWQFDGGQVDQ